jgi:threonine aldolase
MLSAITHTTLLDDVFRSDPTTNDLESHIASLTGHPAALLVLSGTMGNQLALRSHLQAPPHSILCDHRSHILEWEAGGVAAMCGALVHGIVPANGHNLTLKDIEKKAVLSDDVHACPTKVISLENTLNGEIMPLEDCQAISKFARSHDIKIHLDGARIWEAVAAQVAKGEHEGSLEKGLKAYCKCFDSVSLCFSKGLGAPIGSIIVGSESFIKRARHVRKSIGGGLRQAGVITAAARVAVDETFLGGKLIKSHDRAREIAKMWTEKGGKLTQASETNMVWLDLADVGIEVKRFVEIGVRHGLAFLGGRLVVHYQISDEAVQRLGKVMDELLSGRKVKESSTEEKRVAEKVMEPEME